jgi:hypothetical protein
MPRTYLIFGDIEGKLDVLNVECTQCARKGRLSLRRLLLPPWNMPWGVKPDIDASSLLGGGLTDSRVLPRRESVAGGNRARGRQPQPIKNKVDTVDTLTAPVDTHTVHGRERAWAHRP